MLYKISFIILTQSYIPLQALPFLTNGVVVEEVSVPRSNLSTIDLCPPGVVSADTVSNVRSRLESSWRILVLGSL